MHVHIIHQVGHLRHGVNDVVGLRCGVSLSKERGYNLKQELYFTSSQCEILMCCRLHRDSLLPK